MRNEYELIKILGKPCLFSPKRETALPSMFYSYELSEGCSILNKKGAVDFTGTIITLSPFDFGDDDYIELGKFDIGVIGTEISLDKFYKKYNKLN